MQHRETTIGETVPHTHIVIEASFKLGKATHMLEQLQFAQQYFMQ